MPLEPKHHLHHHFSSAFVGELFSMLRKHCSNSSVAVVTARQLLVTLQSSSNNMQYLLLQPPADAPHQQQLQTATIKVDIVQASWISTPRQQQLQGHTHCHHSQVVRELPANGYRTLSNMSLSNIHLQQQRKQQQRQDRSTGDIDRHQREQFGSMLLGMTVRVLMH